MIFETLKFKYPWREYQKAVLESAQTYLDDLHIHVVAPPGSGKTILGIELMRRVAQPAIILAPSITIRNQWASRIIENFTNETFTPDWITTDIKNPKTITVATYQGLFSIIKGDEVDSEADVLLENEVDEIDEIENSEERLTIPGEESEIQERSETTDALSANKKVQEFFGLLNNLGVRTIVVDEAHHLRNEWWKSLSMLKEHLKDPVVIALTATPPYDVFESEWKRYQEFCGEIDCEVPIPELVKTKVICPHQDFLYFSALTDSEKAILEQFNKDIDNFLSTIDEREDLISALTAHPFVQDPINHQEEIFESPVYCSAICSVLQSAGQHDSAMALIEVITVGRETNASKEVTHVAIETFLQNVLFKDVYFQDELFKGLRKELHKDCVRLGILDHRELRIGNPRLTSQLLAQSQSKIDAVSAIVQQELLNLEDQIQCVILADYIRKEYLPGEEAIQRERIGVIPIFEKLRKTIPNNMQEKTCVLTGTIVVIPETLRAVVASELAKFNGKMPTFTPYDSTGQFHILNVSDSNRQHVVAIVTALFEQGTIHIIIGTRSLLGEGWDAPSINTLVLASDVGSFMMSNQMRGRAIRVSSDNPDKVSNVWHVATLAPLDVPGTTTKKITINYGYEYNALKTRFRTFVGVCNERLGIESGMERIDTLPALPLKGELKTEMLEESNRKQFTFARDRKRTRRQWEDSIAARAEGELIHQTEADRSNIPIFPRGFVFQGSYLVALMGIFLLWFGLIRWAVSFIQTDGNFFLILLLIVSLYPLYKLVKLFLRWLFYPSPEKNLERICLALIFALHEIGVVRTNPRMCKVVVNNSVKLEFIACGTQGLTIAENDLVLDALEEIFSPIDNPRYILRVKRLKIISLRRDTWLSVPTIFRNKKEVTSFANAIHLHLRKPQVIYTRNIEGRKALLEARKYSVLNRIAGKNARRSVWQ